MKLSKNVGRFAVLLLAVAFSAAAEMNEAGTDCRDQRFKATPSVETYFVTLAELSPDILKLPPGAVFSMALSQSSPKAGQIETPREPREPQAIPSKIRVLPIGDGSIAEKTLIEANIDGHNLARVQSDVTPGYAIEIGKKEDGTPRMLAFGKRDGDGGAGRFLIPRVFDTSGVLGNVVSTGGGAMGPNGFSMRSDADLHVLARLPGGGAVGPLVRTGFKIDGIGGATPTQSSLSGWFTAGAGVALEVQPGASQYPMRFSLFTGAQVTTKGGVPAVNGAMEIPLF